MLIISMGLTLFFLIYNQINRLDHLYTAGERWAEWEA